MDNIFNNLDNKKIERVTAFMENQFDHNPYSKLEPSYFKKESLFMAFAKPLLNIFLLGLRAFFGLPEKNIKK